MKRLIQIICLQILVTQYTHGQEVTDSFSVYKDAYVSSLSRTTNYGNSQQIMVFQDSGATVEVYRSYLHFDLSSIPVTARITSATLLLFPDSVNNNANHPIYIERVDTTDWTENTLNWDNQSPVYTSDIIAATHAQTSGVGVHSFNVKTHVQNFIRYPYNNNGWRIRLQDESGSVDYGLMYYSGEHDSLQYRPVLEVKYIMPIEITSYPTHCSEGANDGSVDISLTGGSGSYGYYWWFEENVNGSVTTIEQGNNVNNSTIDISALQPGSYIFSVRDSKWNGDQDSKYYFYKRILIGRENDTVSVNVMAIGYTDDAVIHHQKIAGADFDNINYGSNIYMIANQLPVSYGSGAKYDSKGMLKYVLDFDASLNFDTADLYLKTQYGHYRYWTSTNEGYLRRIVEPWEEMVVTWNCQPEVTTEGQVYIPQTHTTNGYNYSPDTLSILSFVNYWQQNPVENHGLEIVLNNYNQSYPARQGWSQSEAGINYVSRLRLSFTVKPKIETVFHDSLGLGDITVNAPAGELPFKYLISNVDTIPDLQVIWPFLRDSLAADSASFFAGIHNTRNYVFTDLPADRYFVSVFDNKGRRLADHQIYLKPQLTLADTTSIVISGDTLRVDSTQANSAHAVLFDGVSLEYEDGGVELEIIQFADEVIVGFNSFSLPICYYDASYEYAIRIQTNQKAYLLKRGTVLDSVNVNIGDQLRLVKNANSVEFYKGTSLLKSDYLKSSQKDDFKIEVGLKGPESALIAKPYGKVTKLPKITITPSICGENFSDVTINGSSFHGFSIVGFKLKEISASVPLYNFPNYPDPFPVILQDVPVGIYTLTTYWSNGIYTTTNQMELVVGYKVNWTDLYNLYESPYPTNSISVNTGYSNGYANSINTTDETSDFWIQFSEKIIPGSTTQTNFYLKNESGSIVGRVRIVSSSGSIYAQFYAGTSALNILSGVPYMVLPTVIQLPTTEPIRIMKTGTLYEFKYKGITVASFTDASTEKKHVFLAMAGSHVVTNIIASFCYPVASPFVQLKTTIDGGHYLANKGILNVEYDEEYNDDDLEFYVYQEAGNDEIGQSTWTASPLSYGDNRLSFDFTSTVCLDNGYYILEIVNKKNEKRYLRFKIVNSTCS